MAVIVCYYIDDSTLHDLIVQMTSGAELTLSQLRLFHLTYSFVLCVSDIVVINSEWFLGYFVGNTMWLIAISYYLYITFLGYNGKSCSRLNALIVFTFFCSESTADT